MLYLRTIFFLVLVSSCRNNSSKVSAIPRVDSIKSSLIGKWGGSDESGAVWRITHDSIYSYNDNKSYPYEIIGNDLVFYNGQSKPHLRNISVIKDTLFFESRVSLENEIYGVVKSFRNK